MTPQQILIVAIRLFAIVWFLTSISHVIAALRLLEGSGPDGLVALVVAIPVLELLVCVFLWFFPATLSRRLLKDGDKPVESPGPQLMEWQGIAVVAIGLWTLSYAIPDAVYWVIYVGNYYQQGADLSYVTEDRWAQFIATAVQVAIGIWLLLGGRNFAAFLFQIRGAGLRP